MAKFNSLNIGDTVLVKSLADTDARCGAPSELTKLNGYIGGTFEVTELARQPSTNLGRVKLSNGWWYSPKGLEVLTSIEPTPEPVAHTTEDFKYTRVRVKGTESEGVVVGRSRVGGGVAVLHDEADSFLHHGNTCEVGFVGVEHRIWYYLPVELEIIGGVQ